MQQLLTYINEHRHSLFEQWYSLAQRLEAAAHHEQHTSLIALFREYDIAVYPLEEHPDILYSEQSGDAPFTLLLWSQGNTSLDKTHQWYALAMRLLTLQLYKNMYTSLPIHIRWIVDVDKKQAGSSIYSLSPIMKHTSLFLQVDGCICDIPAPSMFPAMTPGTKGLLRVSLTVDTHLTKTHALYSSVLPDAIWRLAWCLSSLKDAREELLIEGFYDAITSPEDDEVALLAHVPLEQAFQQQEHIPLLGLQGSQLRYAAQFLPACTLTSIHSDISHSIDTIPTQAQAYLNFYLVPDQQPEDIFALLQQHLHTHGFQDVHLQCLTSLPAMHTQLHHSFIQSIRSATTTVCSTEPAYAEALTLIPFATESVFSSSVLPSRTIPIIFNQFGQLDNNTRVQSTQLAHLAHFGVFLEESGHATTTTR